MADYKASNAYDKYRRVTIRFNVDKDKDIVNFLDMFAKNNVSKVVKDILREKINSNSKYPSLVHREPLKVITQVEKKETNEQKANKADILNNIFSNDF